MEMMDVARARQEVAGLEELLTIRPTPEVIGHLAATYFALGNSAKALPMAEKAYQLSPANPVVVLNLGMVLRDLGRAEEAARYVYEAFLLDPTDLYVRMAYGKTYFASAIGAKRGRFTTTPVRVRLHRPLTSACQVLFPSGTDSLSPTSKASSS